MKPTTERNLDGYGTPPIEWSRVEAVLDSGITQAPGPVGPTATPHRVATTAIFALGTTEPRGATRWEF